MKDRVVSVRFTEGEYADLEWRAKQQGITVSELIRRGVKPKLDVAWRTITQTMTVGAPNTTTIVWNTKGFNG